jgi:hypothetical protein
MLLTKLSLEIPRISALTVAFVLLGGLLLAPGGAAAAEHSHKRPGGELARLAPARALAVPAAGPLAAPGGRLYSPSSPFNQPIPLDPAIAPESGLMVDGLVKAEREENFVLTVGRWTVSTYFADAQTPRRDVALRKAPPQWGEAPDYLGFPPGWSDSLSRPLPFEMHGVPIPAAARPDPSLDAHMTVIDRAAGCEYDFYGAHETADGGWQAIWANSTRLDGTGVYPNGMGTKASGFAGTAGLIFPQELREGHIDHALFFAYPYTKSGGPVSPATSADGLSTMPGALPEGARVQLDPNLDLDSLGLAPFQKTIAKAMQTYGMILGDTGGAFAIFAVGRDSYPADPYEDLLPAGEYPDLSKIPADRFRVISLPPQQYKPPLQLQPSGCGSFG